MVLIPRAQLLTMSQAYVDLPPLIISPWTSSLIPSVCRIRGSNDPSLHHCFFLMSSLFDCFFVESLDNCVMIIINILSSSGISIEFMKRNTILALDDLYYHRPLYCLPFNTNLFVFRIIPWDPCYPAIVLLSLGVLPSFMSIMSWEFHHLLCILGTSDTSCHLRSFLGSRVVSNRKSDNWTMLCDFKILATLLLWSYRSIFHS